MLNCITQWAKAQYGTSLALRGWLLYMQTGTGTIKVVNKTWIVGQADGQAGSESRKKINYRETCSLCPLRAPLIGLFRAWRLAQAHWDMLMSYLKTRLNDLLTRSHTWHCSEEAGTEIKRNWERGEESLMYLLSTLPWSAEELLGHDRF